MVLAPCPFQPQLEGRVECRSVRATISPQNSNVARERVYFVNRQWPVTGGAMHDAAWPCSLGTMARKDLSLHWLWSWPRNLTPLIASSALTVFRGPWCVSTANNRVDSGGFTTSKYVCTCPGVKPWDESPRGRNHAASNMHGLHARSY